MTYLLDTNAVSEVGRSTPDPLFLDWYAATPDENLFLSVVTLGELRRGAELLPVGARKDAVERRNLAILRRFGDQVLPIDTMVALTWGELSANHRKLGVNPSMSDELIAATAITWNLTLVTRNLADFQSSGCRLLSPWTP